MSSSFRFIFREQARQLFNSFTRLFGIRIVFFSADGEEVKVGDDKDMCDYCRMLRYKYGCDSLCRNWDKQKQQQAHQNRRMITYRCHSAMTEAVIPVISENKLLGFIMIGQFRTTDKFEPAAQLQSLPYKDIEKLKEAYYKTPLYPQKKVSEILKLFEVLADFIVSHRLIAIKSSDPVDTLLEYIANHPEQTITPSQAAAMVYRSQSSISHLFKQTTGKSLVQYQIECKLKLAEKTMIEAPEKTIKQIAIDLGYADPLYFSRLYSKKRGFSPTEFKLNTHSSNIG